jgi:hypothetical protein
MFYSKLFEKVHINVTPEILKSFDDLDRDEYFTNGIRNRRFSQFKMSHSGDNWHFEKLPLRPFLQPKQNNPVAGGILRYFRGVKADVSPILNKAVDVIKPDASIDWQINVHQYRVVAKPGIPGSPVPEGPHRDGANYILMLCVRRNNVAGGETTLFDEKKSVIFRDTLQEGEAIIIDDARLFHDASQVLVQDSGNDGYRDIFAIGFIEWSRGKYGPEWERTHTGLVADPALIKHD